MPDDEEHPEKEDEPAKERKFTVLTSRGDSKLKTKTTTVSRGLQNSIQIFNH